MSKYNEQEIARRLAALYRLAQPSISIQSGNLTANGNGQSASIPVNRPYLIREQVIRSR